MEAQRIPKILNDISQRMITDKVRELLTPIQLKQNIENKELKQIFDDLAGFIKGKASLIEETA